MESGNLMVSFVAVSVAALVGGLAAERLRFPSIVGFLIAGVAIRPLLPLTQSNLAGIQTMADIGVALLMFALGTEFSLDRLRSVGRVAVLGGAAQIVATIGIGAGIGLGFGFDGASALYWGCLISLSSTTVVLKLLQARGELDTPFGHIVFGILIVQDLAVVPMMVILPALAGVSAEPLITLGIAFVKALAMLGAVYVLGTRFVPWLFHQVAAGTSRELVPLAVVAVGLGTAIAAHALGLSIAFGGFLAGLLISETEYESHILAEVRPLRDLFGSLFFVSVGMLLDPTTLFGQAALVIALALLVVLTKFLLGAGVTLAFGYPSRVAVPVGLALPQIGEFSFVVAQAGVAEGVVPPNLYSLTLAVSLVTILLTPAALELAPRTSSWLERLPAGRRFFSAGPIAHAAEKVSRRHTVILGYGRVGRELAAALEGRGFSWVAVDLDIRTIKALRKKGAACVYGDAAEPEVLRHARIDQAQLLAVALPDIVTGERAVRRARELNPGIPIIARVRDRAELQRLVAAGVEEVVHPEFETGLEFVRFALRRYGVSGPEVQHLISGRRLGYYEREGD